MLRPSHFRLKKSLTFTCLCFSLLLGCQESGPLGSNLLLSTPAVLPPLSQTEKNSERERLRQALNSYFQTAEETELPSVVTVEPALQARAQAQLKQAVLAQLKQASPLALNGRLLMPQGSKAVLEGLAYQTVKIYLPDGQELASTQTDATGHFQINALPGGFRYEILALNQQSQLIARALVDAPNKPVSLTVEVSPRSTVLADIIRGSQQDGRVGLEKESLENIQNTFLSSMPNLVARLESLIQIRYLNGLMGQKIQRQLKQSNLIAALAPASSVSEGFQIQQAPSPNTTSVLFSSPKPSPLKPVAENLGSIINLSNSLPQCNDQDTSLGSVMDMVNLTSNEITKINQTLNQIILGDSQSILLDLNKNINIFDSKITKISNAETAIAISSVRENIQNKQLNNTGKEIVNLNNSQGTVILSNPFPPPGPCELTLLQAQLPETVPTPQPVAILQPSASPSARPTALPTASPTPSPQITPSVSPSPSASATGLQIKAYPFPNNEYTQIQLEFTGIAAAATYEIFESNRLLAKINGQAGEKLKYLASGLSPDSRYEFRVDVKRGNDTVTGKATTSTWRQSSGGGSSGGGSGGGGASALNQPTLSTLASTVAPIGSTITLTGSNFSAVAAENLVNFGNVSATVTAATANSLTVTVPAGIFGAQNVSVKVNGANSNALSFKVKPQITALATPHGIVSGKARLVRGSSLTLTGTGFDTLLAGNNRVRFGTIEVPAAAVNGNQLIVPVPTALNLPGDINITVIVDVLSSDAVAAILPSITLNANGGFN